MRRCIQLAKNGLQNVKPNPMVGAVLVCDGRIIGEGYHVRYGKGHAEVNCFASVKPSEEHLVCRSTLYVSLEPCAHHGKTPPCADLIVSKGVRRVVVGCIDPFAKVQGQGIQKLRNAGIEVTVGVLEAECLALNRRFIAVNTLHRPYVLLKWAETKDGFIGFKTAMEGVEKHEPLQISTAFTRMLTHKLRAECDAILVGRTTHEEEHPQLNVRAWSGPDPERIVLSASSPSPAWAFSINNVLHHLHQEGCQSLLVEGGARTLEGFISHGLWDELRVETAPFAVQAGVKAPALPRQARFVRQEEYGKNVIKWFCNTDPKGLEYEENSQ